MAPCFSVLIEGGPGLFSFLLGEGDLCKPRGDSLRLSQLAAFFLQPARCAVFLVGGAFLARLRFRNPIYFFRVDFQHGKKSHVLSFFSFANRIFFSPYAQQV